MASAENTAQRIVDEVGGPSNIVSLTHCATRLRFELVDGDQVDKDALEKTPGVMGVVPQSGDRLQVVIGGAVASVYSDITNLPAMSEAKKATGQSDADVEAAARAKARGKFAWLDSFFEYLSDSFRPLLGVLLGASLIIAFAAMLDAFGVVDFRADDKPAGWVFVDAMWRAVLYFLPVMVAYNAAKKLNVDPWLGFTVMAAVMTPNFIDLTDSEALESYRTCTTNEALGTESCTIDIFGLPMQLNDYGGQVFVPLMMVPLLAILYRWLKRVFPENVQMVFVPFISMLVMIPITAFLLGPLGIWLGNGIGNGLAWLNNSAPIVFAVLIPLIYPFLVPLGLHWPLNALMLANIDALGYDFIQGPMGAWNFACFGATAGVLYISWRAKEREMRQVATGALAAGLFGGISEPSLYGIHLRYKRIYPRMLVGCLVGGIIIGIGGGVDTEVFAFTSLLTIPVFEPMFLYAIAVAAAFATAMILVIVSDYRSPEQRAESAAARAQEEADLALEAEALDATAGNVTGALAASRAARAALDGQGTAEVPAAAVATLERPVETLAATAVVGAPVAGRVVPLEDVNDAVFSSKALGEGVGIEPAADTIVSPVSGTLLTVPASGHAYGIKSDDGVEVLVHIGIDTVQLKGEHFDVAVTQGDRVEAGQPLVTVDHDGVRAAGYDVTTILVVTNTRQFAEVTPRTGIEVDAGESVISVVR